MNNNYGTTTNVTYIDQNGEQQTKEFVRTPMPKIGEKFYRYNGDIAHFVELQPVDKDFKGRIFYCKNSEWDEFSSSDYVLVGDD